MSETARKAETFPLAKLVKALKRESTHSPKDVLDGMERGVFQAWALRDSLVITEVLNFPQKRVCSVFCAAGNFDDVWEIMEKQVEPFARARNCEAIQGRGRRGWERSAQERGYATTSIEMRKEL